MAQAMRSQFTNTTMLKQSFTITIALLLSACSTFQSQPPKNPPPLTTRASNVVQPVTSTEQESLRTLVALQDRLYRVAAPLLLNNTELCKGNARHLLGFTAKNKYSYSAEFIEAAHQTFGLDERLQVMSVLSGGGAEKVGMKRGDTLVSIEDKPFPQGQNAEHQAASMLAPLLTGRSNVQLSVRRNNGTNQTLTVPLTHACAFGVVLGNSDNVMAYADGRRMMIARGMLNFVRNDEELAYVLAKEMAHNALRHPKKQRMNATISGIIDNLIRLHPDLNQMSGMSGVKPMPKEFDTAADTLALYMVTRAGYNIENAPMFWQRLATQYPVTQTNSYTAIHPNTTARITTMEKIIPEIKIKRAQKTVLRP